MYYISLEYGFFKWIRFTDFSNEMDRVGLGSRENGFFEVVHWICGYSSHKQDFLHTPISDTTTLPFYVLPRFFIFLLYLFFHESFFFPCINLTSTIGIFPFSKFFSNNMIGSSSSTLDSTSLRVTSSPGSLFLCFQINLDSLLFFFYFFFIFSSLFFHHPHSFFLGTKVHLPITIASSVYQSSRCFQTNLSKNFV